MTCAPVIKCVVILNKLHPQTAYLLCICSIISVLLETRIQFILCIYHLSLVSIHLLAGRTMARCDCDLQKPTTQEKRAKLKTKNITTTFGKSVFLTKHRMRYAIYIPPNTKDLAINPTKSAYGNRQNATALARANNSNLLRSLKHLIETRLYKIYTQQQNTTTDIDGNSPQSSVHPTRSPWQVQD